MCQETTGRNNHAVSHYVSIQVWYMKHAFQDLRISWRCIGFPKTKSKTSGYQLQADMAGSLNLQRAPVAASRTNSLNIPSPGCSETSQWMFRTFKLLYVKKKRRNKDRLSTKVKSLHRLKSSDKSSNQVSSSGLTEIISCVDFDLGNLIVSTDSELPPTGQPPSPRSSDSNSLLSEQIQIHDSSRVPEPASSKLQFQTQIHDSSRVPEPASSKSQFQRTRKHHRRKRSIFRAAKVALTSSSRGTSSAGSIRQPIPPSPASTGIGLGTSRYSLGGMSTSPRTMEKRHPPTPIPAAALSQTNLSRCTTVTMDTSSSPCKSSTTSWLENYDMLTETLSTSSWSLKTDSPMRETRVDHDNSRSESKVGSGEWRRDLHEHDKHDSCFYHDCGTPSSPVSDQISRKDIQRRQESAISGARHTGKDFQEAIVAIIMDNDVHDLVDLEEFLQGYFRLNNLYQDIIQQFFYDLSDDFVSPNLSRAPSVFARLAAANHKSMAATKEDRSRELSNFNLS